LKTVDENKLGKFNRLEFFPQGATVSKHRYKEILPWRSVHRKLPELWLHDNAPAHRFVLVREDLPKQQVTVLPHLP
jgi:hypothetical protein